MVAMSAIRANVMRAVLTTLGIIIGVGAVITMVALGQGAQNRVQDQISRMGTNVLTIRPGQAAFGGVQQEGGVRLSVDDALALKKRFDQTPHRSAGSEFARAALLPALELEQSGSGDMARVLRYLRSRTGGGPLVRPRGSAGSAPRRGAREPRETRAWVRSRPLCWSERRFRCAANHTR